MATALENEGSARAPGSVARLNKSVAEGVLPGEISRKREILLRHPSLARAQADQFFRTVCRLAHDLRGPAGNVVSHSSVLLEHCDDVEPAELRRRVRRILKNAHQLIDTVQNHADQASLESANVRLIPVLLDLSEMVALEIEESADLARDHDVWIAGQGSSGPLPIRGDFNRLRRALHNLVVWLIRHVPKGSSLELTTMRQGQRAVVLMRAPHVQLETNELKILFGRSASTTGHGPGAKAADLGPWVARQFLRRHAGSLQVRSGSDAGTVLRMSLPLWGGPLSRRGP